MRFISVCFLYLILVSSSIVSQEKIIRMEPGKDKVNIIPFSEYLSKNADRFIPSEEIALEEENPNLKWQTAEEDVLSFGYVSFPVWTRFRIQFMEEGVNTYYLRLQYPSLDEIRLIVYDSRSGQKILEWIQGDSLSFEKRIMASHVFPFPVNANQGDDWIFYLKARTSGSLSIPLEILDGFTYHKEETNLYLLFGLYFGLILTMFVYNSVLFFYTKEKAFYYYLLYLMSYFLLVFSGYGFASRYLYTDSVYLNNHFFLISASLNIVASILFSVVFLRVKIYYPKMYWASLGFGSLVLCYGIVFAITGEQKMYDLIGVFGAIPLIGLLTIALFLFNRYRYARYFAMAWTIYMGFYIASILRLIGILPTNFFTYYGIQIGSATEMLILSLAIGHRLYNYKKKSDTLSREIIESKTALNRKLATMVDEKTEALNHSLQLIQNDVEMARNIQLSTIPKNIDWTPHGLNVSSLFLPKDRVSGDIYDLCKLDEDRYRIFLADATGHGIQAGFFTMSIRTEYERIKNQFTDTSQVLRLLNHSIFQTFGNEVMLYSCILIDIDVSQQYLVYSSAGHPEQFLYQNGNMEYLKATGPILGFKKDMEVTSKTVPISREFDLLLFTDGIFEVRNSFNEEFSIERLESNFLEHRKNEFNNFLFSTFQSANEFSKDVGFEDDVTLIYIRRNN